jgi:hypothetical protein
MCSQQAERPASWRVGTALGRRPCGRIDFTSNRQEKPSRYVYWLVPIFLKAIYVYPNVATSDTLVDSLVTT